MTVHIEDKWLVIEYSDSTTLHIDLDKVDGISYHEPRRFDIEGVDFKLTWKPPFITTIKTITEYSENGRINIYVNGKKHFIRYHYDRIKTYREDLSLLKDYLKIADTSSSTDSTAD